MGALWSGAKNAARRARCVESSDDSSAINMLSDENEVIKVIFWTAEGVARRHRAECAAREALRGERDAKSAARRTRG